MDPNDTVILEHENGSKLTVHLFGATVVSWVTGGEENIFISSKSLFDNKKAIRGGIPVVFPQFGPWEPGPQHGFARIQRWAVKQPPLKTQDACTAVFTLTDNDATRAMWDFRFELCYTVTLSASGFTTSFSVTNTDTNDFDFTCLLHTYFKVPDVTQVKVTGLQGMTYTDKVLAGSTYTEDRNEVTVAENVDRVYSCTPDEHVLHGAMGGASIRIKKTNLPDTVVWNPWAEKAASMADFGDNDYPHMICIEAGHVTSRKQLAPGEEFTGSQTITRT